MNNIENNIVKSTITQNIIMIITEMIKQILLRQREFIYIMCCLKIYSATKYVRI